jgi:hypothetical protein
MCTEGRRRRAVSVIAFLYAFGFHEVCSHRFLVGFKPELMELKMAPAMEIRQVVSLFVSVRSV